MNLEAELLKYIKGTYLPGRFRKSASNASFTEKDVLFFAEGALDLSDAFTVGRKNLPRNYFNRKEARSAYLLYFTLTNFAKVTKCLWEADRLTSFRAAHDDIKILDLGSGPGTAALACSAFLKDRRAFITGVDQNGEILKDARALFSAAKNPNHKFETITESIRPSFIGGRLREKRFNLIVAANILNEIGPAAEQQALCQTLIDRHLEDDGILIVIDPALQNTTRALMEVRDNLNAEILSPCTHQKPCPMFAHNRRDWCHFYLEWNCPEIIRKVDRLLEIRHDYLKMAYLILQKKRSASETEKDSTLWRVVSSPLSSKGKCEFVLCGEGRLRRICRLDRDQSDKNRSFGGIKRGDVLKVSFSHDRIGRNDSLSVEVPFKV